MWISAMVVMMLSATTPTVDAFATMASRRRARGQPYTPAVVFVAGYLLAWSCFSAAVVAAQWQLYRAALLTPTLQNTSLVLVGAALLVAGHHQFTLVKMRVCEVPQPPDLHHDRIARRLCRRADYGASAWTFLSALPGVDVADVLCRGDELALGGGLRDLCHRREPHSRWRYNRRTGSAPVLGGMVLIAFALP
jgi:Predicted metal-binding integral membrane protein (DUF2182)